MKQIFIFLFYLIFSYTAFAQEFDLNNINKKDNKGLKQGLWFYYKVDTTINKSYKSKIKVKLIKKNEKDNSYIVSDSIKENSVKFIIDTTIIIKISKIGFYNNDKKDSTWKIFDPPMYYSKRDKNPDFSDAFNRHLFNLKYIAFIANDSNIFVKEYYPNGNIKNEYSLINNKLNGLAKIYNQNGLLEYAITIIPDVNIYDGSEYNILGRKVRDRKFNPVFVKERIIIDGFIEKFNDK